VHAGVHPDRPLDQQDEHDLLWIRQPLLSSEKDFGRLVVHGHTPTTNGLPDQRRNGLSASHNFCYVWLGMKLWREDMAKKLIVFILVEISWTSSSAETIKRDIRGFRNGMTPNEFKLAGQPPVCKSVWLMGNYALCERPSGQTRAEIAPKTGTIYMITESFSASGSVPEVLSSVCKQFTTDCGAIELGKSLNLGDGDILIVRKSPGMWPTDYDVVLGSQAILDAEKRAPDPNSAPVPKF
jgi:hypothetical protein